MKHIVSFLIALSASSAPAVAQSEAERDFAGALRGCEEWIVNPASWSDGVAPFTTAVGLGDAMSQVQTVPDAALPPPGMRRGNRYWHITGAGSVGYFLVVSDQLPICHLTGGGDADLQPVVEAVLVSPAFQLRWREVSRSSNGEMATTVFQNRAVPSLSITISRPSRANQRQDRVQVLGTATYSSGH